MFDSFPFLAVFFALAALTLSPGLDTVLVLRNATRGGAIAGLLTSFGICCGLFVHGTISALGLSVLLLQSATLFSILKFAGAFFLLYLGCQSLLAAYRGDALIISSGQATAMNPVAAFRDGFLTNLLNPKLIIFYMLFLPQFIDPTGSALSQSLLIAGIHFLQGMVWLGSLAFAVHGARIWLSRPALTRSLNGGTGGLLVAFGIQLALFERTA